MLRIINFLNNKINSYLYDRKNHNISLNKPDGNNEIYHLLISNKPCLVSRFGSTELELIMDYEKNKFKKNVFWNKKQNVMFFFTKKHLFWEENNVY
jgi:hypothetical protein